MDKRTLKKKVKWRRYVGKNIRIRKQENRGSLETQKYIITQNIDLKISHKHENKQ